MEVACNSENKNERFQFDFATEEDRGAIYAMRHDVYASELGQHSKNAFQRLEDKLDSFNHYIVARREGKLVGFVSITPPSENTYSIDKYFSRDKCPFEFDETLYEVRLLTVNREQRGSALASLLMYAAFRFIESQGGKQVVGIGRKEIMDLYKKAGMKGLGHYAKSGAVTYELMTASIDELEKLIGKKKSLFQRYGSQIVWNLPMSFYKAGNCYHGGAFFKAIGEDFKDLEKHKDIISADVLDAWFQPSPKVIETLQSYLPWISRTSPPTQCEGLIEAIATARGVSVTNILPGAGSSDLMFRVLPRWISSSSRVLLIDPAYGEYKHLFEQVICCEVDYFQLTREEDYRIDTDKLARRLQQGSYDLFVLVNPNNPTGKHIEKQELERLLKRIPQATRVWIDEAYLEYVGSNQSLEKFAVNSQNVVVCKSMSKVYALSGMRIAYLCGHAGVVESLKIFTPPWVVSLPAQIAAVKALSDPRYYAACYAKTHELRVRLDTGLKKLGLSTVEGVSNYVLAHLPKHLSDADDLINRCRNKNLFIRNAGLMRNRHGDPLIRIAVKDEQTLQRILAIMNDELGSL